MKGIERVSVFVSKALNFMVAVTFITLIAACVLQVFTRYVLNDSLSWTEELARYAFIWSNLLGAALCTRNGSHATVTAVTDLLPEAAQRILKIAVYLVMAAVAFVLVKYGWQVVTATWNQKSPALRISMAGVYGSSAVCGLFILFYSVVHLAQVLYKLRGKGENS